MEQTSFTNDRELEVNGWSNTDWTLAPVRPDAGHRVWLVHLTEEIKSGVTGRWEVMRPDAEGQRPVDSSKGQDLRKCDRTRPVDTDRTLRVQRPVESSKVPVRVLCDRTRPISADRTLLVSGRLFTTGSRVELTGASGHHDRSVRSSRRSS